MDARVQILVSLDVLDWAVVIWVFGADLVVGSGIVGSVKIGVSFLSVDHIATLIFVKIAKLILILILLLKLRIWNNVNLLWLLLVALAWHNDLVWHVGAVLLWNNVLTWVQHYHLLKLILVVLECLVLVCSLMVHLLWNIYFFVSLHLWDSNDLVTVESVVLLDWLHWHAISVGILRGLVGWVGLKVMILLLNIMVLLWDVIYLWNLHILRFHVLHHFLILLQKLSWWQVLSHYQASIWATWRTFRSIELMPLHFFNWIILLYLLIWLIDYILISIIISLLLLLMVVLKLLW